MVFLAWYFNICMIIFIQKILQVVSLSIPTLFKYCMWAHPSTHCSCPWSIPSPSHGWALWWGSSKLMLKTIYIVSLITCHAFNFMINFNMFFHSPIWWLKEWCKIVVHCIHCSFDFILIGWSYKLMWWMHSTLCHEP